MGLKLSIVVPIYKVEQYLSKCVDSLLHQDLLPEEYEIILVDDGSPDRCGEMCEEYALHYSNIKVVHRDNGGLSAARNSGIDIAQGKYLQFVDPDDYLEPNVLGSLIQKMESEELDMLRFDYRNVNEEGAVVCPFKDPKRFVDYKDEVCDGLTFLNKRLGPACYAWQFVIRASLLEDRTKYFKPGIYFEDTEWLPRVLLQAGKVTSVDTVAYNYLIRAGSITNSKEKEKIEKILKDKLLLVDSMREQMKEVPDKRWFEGMVSMTVISILDIVSGKDRTDRKRLLKVLRDNSIYPLSEFQILPSFRKRIKIINLSPTLYCLLLNIKRG